MKTKTILSVCVLSIFLYACSKDTPTPELVLDCMEVENGVAALDDCGNCHQSYVYGGFAHNHSVEYISDTSGLVIEAGYTLILAGSEADIANNSNWNGGPLATIDSCGDCHSSYIYDFVAHTTTDINDTAGLVLGANEMFILAGSPEDIANNPNWNTGCE